MTIKWLEDVFNSIPLPFLEVWGRFGFILGLGFMICAFGGFTFRPGGHWGFGRERQTWDTKALVSSALTFILVIATGYIGSFIVLVPGAQTFESLKDLSVFLCITLFGYPALVIVPFAYGISDLIEQVPPSFLLDWLPGYFINPACFWVGYQLIGRNPDFRRARTWGWYLVFVFIFMSIEPVLWGYICSGKFTSVISYGNITPALMFTTAITWILGPFFMLGALPLARKFGLFRAENPEPAKQRMPIRMFLATPFILLALTMVASTAYVVLRSAERDANKLASRLHQEISQNINLQLDEYLDSSQDTSEIQTILQKLAIANHGRAFVFDRSGSPISSSHTRIPSEDSFIQIAVNSLRQEVGDLERLKSDVQYRFDIVTAKPLSRETWLAQATPYEDRRGGHSNWIVLTAMPESYYLDGIRTGNSRSAMLFALALILALLVAAALAAIVAGPIRRISRATQKLAQGDLTQRLPTSRLEELDALASSFNEMAGQLHSSFERMQLAVRAGNLGIWDWDIPNDAILWDESMYRQYGVTKEEFDADFSSWSSCLVPEDLERAKADVEAVLRGEREYESEFRIRRPDGSIRFIKAMAQTIRNEFGRPLRMVGINTDITAQKTAQQELLRHRDHLEELVRERTAALSVAVAQAESATQAKSDFLANMSHEIRTPLNAILGMTRLTLRTRLSPQQEDYLRKTQVSANSLLRIIDDILDFSKIEAGKLQIENEVYSIEEVLDRVRILVGQKAQEKGLKLVFDVAPDVPPLLVGDPLRLSQVLTNLSNNAVKFTERGEIVIRAQADEPVSDNRARISFSVRDTGIGMDERQMLLLFQPFTQADSSHSRKYGGTGLGLAISKQLVQLMGGEIGVTSKLGVGSEFRFTAELGIGSESYRKKGAPSRDDSIDPRLLARIRGKRILVVEDNEINQQVARELLTDLAEIRVTVARDGQEALERLNSEMFDLVLADIQMPVMNGYELAKAMRGSPQFANLPIVAMTANAMPEDRLRCLTSGMNDCVIKPFVPRELFEVISRYVDPPHPSSEISISEGLRYCAGRKSLYENALRTFVATSSASTAQIREELAKGDRARAAAIAHGLISVAGTLGAANLSKIAKHLELTISQSRCASSEQLIKTLEDFDRKLSAALSEAERICELT